MGEILRIIIIATPIYLVCGEWFFSLFVSFLVVLAFSASKILGIMSLFGAGFFLWAAWQGETQNTRHRSGKNWRNLTSGKRSAIQRNRRKR